MAAMTGSVTYPISVKDVPQLFDLVDGEVSAHGGNLGA